MTRREEIFEILKKEKKSAQSIANHFEVELFWIIEDLEHLKKSIHPLKLKMQPSFCKKCGFIFKERSKIKAPSKCPKCKSEWIQAPLFSIEKN